MRTRPGEAARPGREATVAPVEGGYHGVDHHGRNVSLSFNGAGGSSEWTSWSASITPFVPYTGTYTGVDHRDVRTHFRYSHGFLRPFTWNGNLIGDARVRADGSVSACHETGCFRGHWQDEYYVVGAWQPTSSSTWTWWYAEAYSP